MTSTQALPQKITQLQCASTNNYLQAHFLQSATDSFKYKPALLAFLQDQLQTLIGYAQYKLTIAADKPQPGDFLQNIQFMVISKRLKVLFLLLSVVFPYLLKKLKNLAAKRQSPGWKMVEDAVMKCQKIVTVLQFVNYAVFILKGEYRSLVQRVLGIKMRFIDSENKRILNFSLMNRMLVWKVYEFFLKNILPSAFSLFKGPLKNLFYLSSYLQPDTSQDGKGCVFCSSGAPISPVRMVPCQHRACYYCKMQNQVEKCPLCSAGVEKWEKVGK